MVMQSINCKITDCCLSFNFVQRFKSSCCGLVSATGVLFSANSWDKVIPKARQIFSSEGTVGKIFLRYQEDIVDCGKPERSAS